MKTISIIIPTLNQGTYIEECILSVLNQNYKNLEFIVIDGGSTDDTIEILQKYKSHFSHCISESDQGQSDAINKGLKLATGDVINWLNSDDFLEPGSLQKINDVFQDNAVNVFSGRSNIVKNGEKIAQSKGLDVYENNLPKTIAWARIDQPETYWRKAVVDEIGYLDKNLHYIMDRDWWVKYLMIYGLSGIVQSEDIIANFRLHNDSKTVSSASDFNLERDKYFSRIIKKSYLDFPFDLIADYPIDSTVDGPETTDVVLKYGITNYFLMLHAIEKYEQSDFKSFKKIYEHINEDFLEKEDSFHLMKLHIRSKILPAKFHKILKGLRR